MTHENLYTPNCIRTFSGHYIDPLNPDPDKIVIEDIAHALAQQPRFGGHLPHPYSVAQHSIYVSMIVGDPAQSLAGLLHDAAEAYLVDVPRPVKDRLTGYREIEDNLMRVIAAKFRFTWPLHPCVKEADEKALQAEWDTLMLNRSNHISFGVFLEYVQPFVDTTKALFIRTFTQLSPTTALNS